MGIRSQLQASTAEFEPMDDEVATVAIANETVNETETVKEVKMETITAETIAKNAIAIAASTAVAQPVATSRTTKAFADKELAIPIEDVRQWFAPSPSIIATSGSAKHSKIGILGKKFVFQIDSYNVRFLAVPGTMDKEAKGKIRNSYDGQTLDEDGSSIKDYVDSLKAEGYSKAHVENYCDLWGRVVWSEKTGTTDPMDDSFEARVQLSKTSAGNFNYFCGKRGRLEASGLVAKLATIEITAVAMEGKSGDYTNFSFAAPKA